MESSQSCSSFVTGHRFFYPADEKLLSVNLRSWGQNAPPRLTGSSAEPYLFGDGEVHGHGGLVELAQDVLVDGARFVQVKWTPDQVSQVTLS